MTLRDVKNYVRQFVPDDWIWKGHEIIDRSQIVRYSSYHNAPFDCDALPFGINLIGYFKQNSGLGQSCRLLARVIRELDIPFSFVNVDVPGIEGNDTTYDGQLNNSLDPLDRYKYGINLICINMGDFLRYLKSTPAQAWDKHYNIAYWLWEVKELPKEWIPFINRVDEIWTPSEFISQTFRQVTKKNVVTIPYALEAPWNEKYSRKYFQLPENRFLFLMMFDSNSITERKNPIAVIHAFKKAFTVQDEVGLVIKISHIKVDTSRQIKKMLEGYHVYYIDGIRQKEEVDSLIRDCNVYVSLHRGEGFGLVLAEAMLLGTPTIATNYSANTEFQSKESACMVNYKLIALSRNIWPYKKGFTWADPDVSQAAEYMKKLYTDKNFYCGMQKNGQQYILNKLSIESIRTIMKEQIKRIYESV